MAEKRGKDVGNGRRLRGLSGSNSFFFFFLLIQITHSESGDLSFASFSSSSLMEICIDSRVSSDLGMVAQWIEYPKLDMMGFPVCTKVSLNSRVIRHQLKKSLLNTATIFKMLKMEEDYAKKNCIIYLIELTN